MTEDSLAGRQSGAGKIAPSRRQLTWLIFFRVLGISLFLGGTIVYQLRGDHPSLPLFYLLVAVSYLQALLSAALLPRVRRLRHFTHGQLVWDLLFCTTLVYLTGGVASLFSFAFLLVVLSGAIFLGRRELFFLASAAAILYGSLLDLQFYGYLPLAAGLSFPPQVAGDDVFYAVFVNVVGFFLTALLGGTLSERLRRSERALERKEIDYEELEDLNRTILANVSGGLMIVNPHGRIRSFNAAAERITGLSLKQVYDRNVSDLFPGLSLFTGRLRVVGRAEGRFNAPDGKTLILGYSSSLVKDPEEKTLGLLVTFQDLTLLKTMEEELRRADRLAAVGRLAAGMAHEIRNPLASISGSVQLLMEGEGVSSEDRRLMGIVVREAERLSGLLTDFLDYARPAPPRSDVVDVAAVVDEVAAMFRADGRFATIEIRCTCPEKAWVRGDRDQLRQALINLAINGAEAMVAEGVLLLGCDPAQGELFVEDSGPGIPEELRGRVFDPFFSTKKSGSGLGLATVHSIVEAHGGEVRVSQGQMGGSRFTIALPPLDGAAESRGQRCSASVPA